MPTTDRDNRIKTHPAAARHPELVQRLLARDWDLDKCMRSLEMADAPPPCTPVASTTSPATITPASATSPATESEMLAQGILDSYYGRNTRTSPATEADTVAAGIMDSYRAYVNIETQSEASDIS